MGQNALIPVVREEMPEPRWVKRFQYEANDDG